ncbi:MAG: hypothetical protein IKL73_02985 [Lachnospiraceae bacterium]|nr:hypothetical protein [Lachnospiraceae bacterium]
MKCKNCGANYKTRELKCPYCNTENLIGKIWMVERGAAELEYEKTRKELGKKLSTYTINRILNRTLLIFALACFLATVMVIGVIFVQAMSMGMKEVRDTRKTIKRFEKLYEEGRYSELTKEVMDSNIGDDEIYTYKQVALMTYDYDEYLNNKYIYYGMSTEEKLEDDFYLEYAIKHSVNVYKMDYNNYKELNAKNQAVYDMYSKEILSFWKYTLKFTDEDIEFMKKESYLSSDDLKGLIKKAKEATCND